jgi:hypothetical protein
MHIGCAKYFKVVTFGHALKHLPYMKGKHSLGHHY